jgi:hypothetical protein
MLRTLSRTLIDLHGGFESMVPDSSLRITGMELALPVDLVMLFADGGCQLLADVPRTRSEGALAAPPSLLRVCFAERPLADLSGDPA